MKVFEILPPSLFSLLVSKNRELYMEALLVLHKLFRQEMSISRSDLISMLMINLDERILTLDLEADRQEFAAAAGPAGSAAAGPTVAGSAAAGSAAAGPATAAAAGPENASVSATAHLLIRRLIDTKWIETEYRMDSFEEDITLPDYTVKLLDLFVSLTSDEAREYNSYVYATYSALKTADAERNDYLYNALVTAYNNTTRLIDELKTLHNNIRRHHQALNDFATANDVLKGHFDIYKTLIMDRIYHPLKTLDSVPRFKAPILRILADWLSDLPLRQMMSDQAIQRGKFSAPEEAMEDILRKISNIMDLYEGMDAMLEQIDRKNTAYTRSSIEKMRYLLNTDRSIKGKLVDLLTDIARNPVHAAKILGFDSCINLYRQGFVDEKSLYTRTDRSALREGVPLKIAEFGETFGDSQVQGFIHRARLIYTSQKALKYIEELMAGRVVLSSPEIKLSNDHDFILLMLATLRSGDRNLFYRVEFLEGTLESGGYRIPNMRFVRKEVKAHVG